MDKRKWGTGRWVVRKKRTTEIEFINRWKRYSNKYLVADKMSTTK